MGAGGLRDDGAGLGVAYQAMARTQMGRIDAPDPSGLPHCANRRARRPGFVCAHPGGWGKGAGREPRRSPEFAGLGGPNVARRHVLRQRFGTLAFGLRGQCARLRSFLLHLTGIWVWAII